MKKREIILISVLTVLIAFMDISGLPSVLFVDIQVSDIEPIYFALMINFLLIGLIASLCLKFLCSKWELGLNKNGFAYGLKRYGLIGFSVALIGLMAFYVGLMPFDKSPSLEKVIIEGVVYYIGVALVEELYIRGLLLNLIEKLFSKKGNATFIAIVLSSTIFGIGHIFGTLGQPILVIISKVIWTIGMGLFFGMVYKKTGNLWLPILFHFLINVCVLPYCFSTISGYADLTLYIILPTYILLGGYSIMLLKKD